MGAPGKIYATDEKTVGGDEPADTGRPRVRIAHRQLVLMWMCGVLVPWVLQVRSFSQLIARHKITLNLTPPQDAEMIKNDPDVAAHCPTQGLFMAGAWFNMNPTHYYQREDGSSLCRFVVPQYNMHGAYNIQNRTIEPRSTAPRSCVGHSNYVNFYLYHGSIGYYAFYTEGEGSYCSNDFTAYVLTNALGSNDINFNALANFEGGSGYYTSFFFGIVGAIWIAYRAIVLTRSFTSCSRYGRRLDQLGEPISLSSAVVYLQQASRIAPHNATMPQRFGLLYLLVEGLMTDLFLIIVHEGFSAKLQYISLGYNIAGLLSMLFEILENTSILKPSLRLLCKRVFFNTEMAIWGELMWSAFMSYYITSLNRSDMRDSVKVAQAVSYYVWSLVSHSIVVVSQTAFILSARTIGTCIIVRLKYGSLKMLALPNCVDTLMGHRYKVATVTGYEYRNSKLYYSKESLKAHGLIKGTDIEGKEYLVYHKIFWLPSAKCDLAILGKITGEHVEPCTESLHSGPVAVCSHVLAGVTDNAEQRDEMDELESARLVEGADEFSDWD